MLGFGVRAATVLARCMLCGYLCASCAAPAPAPAPAAPTAAPPPPAPPKTREQVYGELVQRIVTDYAALGFAIDPKKIAVTIGAPERVQKDVAKSSRDFGVPGLTDALAALLQLQGKPDATPELVENVSVTTLSQAVQAYYDYPTQSLVFRDTELARMSGIEPLVAHELAHAYQDQVQESLQEYVHRDFATLDARRAAHVMIEGQAQLLSLAVLLAKQHIALDNVDPAVSDNSLGLLNSGAGLSAIYEAGRRFELVRYKSGGFAAAATAFSVPPSSTEQVIHPEKFGRDLPQTVELAPLPGSLTQSADVVFEDTFGELLLYTTLAGDGQTLDEAYLVATGWDGDRMRVLHFPDGGYGVMWRLVWDRPEDANQFVAFAKRWSDANHGTVISSKGSSVDVVFANDAVKRKQLQQVLSHSPLKSKADPGDARSTADSEGVRLFEISRRPRVEDNRWVLQEFGTSLAVPPGFRPMTVKGNQVLVGQVEHAFAENITVLFEQDLYGGNLDRYLTYARSKLAETEQKVGALEFFSSNGVRFAQLDVEAPTQQQSVHVRMFVASRNGRIVTIACAFRSENWPARVHLTEELRASLRFGE